MTPAIQPETLPANTAEATPLTGNQTGGQLAAILGHAAVAPLSDTGWLRITGDDRVRWLNGMVTNSIQNLVPGHGNYNFILSAKGRIQGDGYVFAEPDALLLESATSQIPNLITLLDHFIIMDDVELTDVSSNRTGLLVAGPEAAALLRQINLDTADLAALTRKSASWQSAAVTILQAYSPLVPRFELWADPAIIPAMAAALVQAGATSVEPSHLEALRLLEGTPRYGTDIRDKELPQETAQTRALHFSKGCYLGQEIVERIRSRGQVHRIFTAFHLEGALPPAGTALEADGKQIGELTSTASIPLSGGPLQLALGYARRDALELFKARNLPLTYPGGTATAVSVPFMVPAAG